VDHELCRRPPCRLRPAFRGSRSGKACYLAQSKTSVKVLDHHQIRAGCSALTEQDGLAIRRHAQASKNRTRDLRQHATTIAGEFIQLQWVLSILAPATY